MKGFFLPVYVTPQLTPLFRFSHYTHMPAQRQTHQAKYNYSEETLTRLFPCLNCGKQFGTQGIKSHGRSSERGREGQS